MNLDQIRERLFNEMAYRETMVGCMRRILREDAQDIDADEVEKWVKLAEETTKGLDLIVGATYEYLQARVKGVGLTLPEAPPPPEPPPPAPRPRRPLRCPIPDDGEPPPF